MNALFLVLLLQSALLLPPRTALENPAAVTQIPKKLEKDYKKMWTRFLSGKEDAKLVKDVDKFLRKQNTFDPAWTIEGYLALYNGDDAAAREKFTQALAANAGNRIALYYLAELAFAHTDYARAATLYAQLQKLDSSRPEIETKRQKAFLLATDNFLRAAARAESENRLAEAEDLLRQALKLAPNEPVLEQRLADVLMKENKKEEAAALRKTEDAPPASVPEPQPSDEVKTDDLEDLGRWGADIEVFHAIRGAEAITREQFAVLTLRYFPQLTELRRSPEILTDIQNSPARQEILTVVGIGVMSPLPNHEFGPSAPLSRGELAVALSHVAGLLGVVAGEPASFSAADVAPSNALYPQIQLVVGKGLMAVENSGNFNPAGTVPGRQAVNSLERLLRLIM